MDRFPFANIPRHLSFKHLSGLRTFSIAKRNLKLRRKLRREIAERNLKLRRKLRKLRRESLEISGGHGWLTTYDPALLRIRSSRLNVEKNIFQKRKTIVFNTEHIVRELLLTLSRNFTHLTIHVTHQTKEFPIFFRIVPKAVTS